MSWVPALGPSIPVLKPCRHAALTRNHDRSLKTHGSFIGQPGPATKPTDQGDHELCDSTFATCRILTQSQEKADVLDRISSLDEDIRFKNHVEPYLQQSFIPFHEKA